MRAPPATAIASGRRRELDLIRAAVVVGVVFFHTACIFRPEKFYVNNHQSSFGLALFVFLAQLWGMPVMFMVAGGGIWHSLRSRTAGAFVQERIRRLLAPLIVGALLVVPRSSTTPPGPPRPIPAPTGSSLATSSTCV